MFQIVLFFFFYPFFGKRWGFGLRFVTQFILAWLFYVFFPTIYSLSSCSIVDCTLLMLKTILFHFFSVININSGYDLQKWKKRCFFRFKTAYQSLTMTCHVKEAESILHLFNSPEGQESCDSLAENNFAWATFRKFGAMCGCVRKNAEASRNCCLIYLKSKHSHEHCFLKSNFKNYSRYSLIKCINSM